MTKMQYHDFQRCCTRVWILLKKKKKKKNHSETCFWLTLCTVFWPKKYHFETFADSLPLWKLRHFGSTYQMQSPKARTPSIECCITFSRQLSIINICALLQSWSIFPFFWIYKQDFWGNILSECVYLHYSPEESLLPTVVLHEYSLPALCITVTFVCLTLEKRDLYKARVCTICEINFPSKQCNVHLVDSLH